MTEITGATVTFTDFSAPGTPRLLNIPDVWGDATVQDLWDTLSAIAALETSTHYAKLIDRPKGGGKGVLSATKTVGISLVMNNVRVKFADQPGPTYVIKRITDGNCTAIDHLGAEMEAIESSDFTNWKNEADVSAAIVNAGGSGGLTAAELIMLRELYERMDLEITKPNTYANDGSGIKGGDFSLTRTDDGTNTTIQRS